MLIKFVADHVFQVCEVLRETPRKWMICAAGLCGSFGRFVLMGFGLETVLMGLLRAR